MRGRRRSTPHSAAAGLESLLDDLAPDDAAGDPGLARIQRAWAAAVGTGIAPHGKPVAVRDGTLHVACSDATWAQEIQFRAPTLLARLHAAGIAEVSAIRVRAGG